MSTTGANDQVAQDYFNVAWPLCLVESKVTGVTPEVIFAQSALETGYGLHTPQNNFFGIKGAGGNLTTTEYVHGVATRLQQHFTGYASMASSFQGYANFLLRNRRYKNFRSAGSISAELVALGTSGYATDPNYAMKVGKIVDLIPQYLQVYSETYKLPVSAPVSAPVAVTQAAHAKDANVMTTVVQQIEGFFSDHKSALSTASNIIKGLLQFAPIPEAASNAIGDVVTGLDAMVQAPIPVVTDPVTGVVSVASPIVAAETPAVVVEPVAGNTTVNIEGTLLADAIKEGEALVPDLFAQYTSGNLTLRTAEGDAALAAEHFIDDAEKDVFNPALGIVKSPTSN